MIRRTPLVLAALGAVLSVSPADAGPGGSFQIIAFHSTRCLDVTGASLADGASIQQYQCLGPAQRNQLWDLVPTGTGFQIVALHSGKCLDVTGASLANGAPIQQYRCLGAAQTNQIWSLVPVTGTNGTFQIVAQHSGKCLDVTGVSQANGAPIQQYACLGAGQLNQTWFLNFNPLAT